MSELQAAMQFYEESDHTADLEDDAGHTGEDEEVQVDTEMRVEVGGELVLFKVTCLLYNLMCMLIY